MGRRLPLLALTLALASGTALAAGEPLDRATLSVDENVVINTICGAARTQGSRTYAACIDKQLAALKASPTPDLSGLAEPDLRRVQKLCEQFRRVDIGQLNVCLAKAIATAPAKPDKDDDLEGLVPRLSKVFTETSAPAAQKPAAPAAPPPLPEAVLKRRPSPVQKAAASPAELFKTVEKSIFVVLATRSMADVRARDLAQGSAVAVSDNLLLTNCHVVSGRPLIKIVQDKTVDDATLEAADPKTDRCVLRAATLKLQPVPGIAGFDSLQVGTRAFAIGAPRSMERTLSEGLVSGLRHLKRANLVQTSAPVSPGSSGGGLFDEAGNLIGITTLGSTAGTQNLNFAIAASDYFE